MKLLTGWPRSPKLAPFAHSVKARSWSLRCVSSSERAKIIVWQQPARVLVGGLSSVPPTALQAAARALQGAGVADIVVCSGDVSDPTVAAAMASALPLTDSPTGNHAGMRLWQGPLTSLPYFMGSADGLMLIAGSTAEAAAPLTAQAAGPPLPAQPELRAALLHATTALLKPGAQVLVQQRCLPQGPPPASSSAASGSSNGGEGWEVAEALLDLPLDLLSVQPAGEVLRGLSEGAGQCVAHLEVPGAYALPAHVRQHFSAKHIVLKGPVVRGYGRGSRQLGTPTANIDPGPLQAQLATLPRGVYFGWGRLETPASWAAADADVHKVVVNIGTRPTVSEGGQEVSVEVHLMHAFVGDTLPGQPQFAEFYGTTLQVAICGYIRPEMKFSGLDALLRRIKTDIGIAANMLNDPLHSAMAAFV